MTSSGGEFFVVAAYLSGAVCIVLCTLALGWIIVWKCVLSKMPFVQELFDLKPARASSSTLSASSTTALTTATTRDDAMDCNAINDNQSKPISFTERVEAAKRKRLSTKYK